MFMRLKRISTILAEKIAVITKDKHCYLGYTMEVGVDNSIRDCVNKVVRDNTEKMRIKDIIKNPRGLQDKINNTLQKKLKKEFGVDLRYFEIIEFTSPEAR